MAKITFLGTAGGRFAMLSQVRATGGIIIEMDSEMLHIDPGPGALVRAKEYGVKLRNLTGVLVTHGHLDHYNDAEVVIEAMTLGVQRKHGTLLTNRVIIEGSEKTKPVISPFHLNTLQSYKIMKPGDKARTGTIEITATKIKHGDSEGIGFVLSGTKRIGITSDGEYYKGQEDWFKGCDCLLVSCLRPRDESWPEHMNAEQAKELISKAKPKLAVLTSLGMKMLGGVAEKEAKWITEQTGIRTIAAKDGQVLEID